MPWRLLRSPPLDGAVNMAVDMALLDRARRTGERVMRVYEWKQPTLSLGRNQPAREQYAPAGLAGRGIDVVRRPTGGRAILHWHELTYSVTAPSDELSSLAADYARINRLILRALALLGVEAETAHSDSPAPRPTSNPCFAEPSAGEIMLRSNGQARKLVGSAQYRHDGALLQHGSILLEDDQELLLELTREPAANSSAASLSVALGRTVSAGEVADALFAAVGEMDGAVAGLDPGELSAATAAYEERFRDPLWTWRR